MLPLNPIHSSATPIQSASDVVAALRARATQIEAMVASGVDFDEDWAQEVAGETGDVRFTTYSVQLAEQFGLEYSDWQDDVPSEEWEYEMVDDAEILVN